MIITWDEAKRVANFDKHGLDFADLTLEFFRDAIVYPAKEGRLLAIGRLAGIGFVAAVIFAPRGTEAISVISIRPASTKEVSHAP
ncbi:MAG: BrnT family toxin [Roseiarcus sp.]